MTPEPPTRARLVSTTQGSPIFRVEATQKTDGPEKAPFLEVVRQVRATAAAGAFYVALSTALTLPDICSAAGDSNGKTSRPKYIAWLTDHGHVDQKDAELIYGFRCSLLHEGRAYPHRSEMRVAFVARTPDAVQLNWIETQSFEGEVVLWLHADAFIDGLCRAAEDWFRVFGETATVAKNLDRFIQWRAGGLDGHLDGSPVIA